MDYLNGATMAPKLAAPNPGEAATWYKSQLGFQAQLYENGGYAVLKRGDMVLHLWKCDDRYIAEHTACYCSLRDVAALNALHAEWLEQSRRDGFSPGRLQPEPEDAPHGMREFHVWDPAGNLIGFGAAL